MTSTLVKSSGSSAAFWRILALLFAICLAAGAYVFGSATRTALGEPTLVESPASRRLVAAPGLIEPVSEERNIGALVTGSIKEMRVEENDTVVAGQIIAVIDNAEQTARVASARAELALRHAELDRIVNGARAEEREEARAALNEAEARLDLARREHARRLPLTQSGVSPKAALDLATSNLHASQAQRAAKAEKLTLVEKGARAEDILAARAHVRLAEANVALAEAQLEKTYVRSPVTGSVLRRIRVAGETVSANPPTPIAVVGDIHTLRVRAEVDETNVGQVKVGDRVEVTADAFPGKKFEGVVSRLSTRMGAKQVMTGQPTDKRDAKVLQAIIDLDPDVHLPIGLRVDAYFSEGGLASVAPSHQ